MRGNGLWETHEQRLARERQEAVEALARVRLAARQGCFDAETERLIQEAVDADVN